MFVCYAGFLIFGVALFAPMMKKSITKRFGKELAEKRSAETKE